MSPDGALVIVGAGPAGNATARAYREAGGAGPVMLIGAEQRAPYERPPLTKEFLREEAGEHDLPIEEDSWFATHEVELRTATTVTALDPVRGTVTLDDARELPFGQCVLATGSEPVRLPVPGGDDPAVLTVRTVEDALALRDHGERVTVIGSGFIGCEAAASLASRGAAVTLISDEPLPQSARLGDEVGGRLTGWLEEAGVALVLGTGVRAIEAAEGRWEIATDGDVRIAADTVVQAVGVKPRIGLAMAAGLAEAHGAIATDSSMRTSAAGVFAVGDIACAMNPTVGRRLRVEHWGEALAHGGVAGAVLAGRDAEWDTAPGFWSTIGRRALKYVAWGDGFASVRIDGGADGSFTAWYADSRGVCVGALCHDRDDDYEHGRELVESGAAAP